MTTCPEEGADEDEDDEEKEEDVGDGCVDRDMEPVTGPAPPSARFVMGVERLPMPRARTAGATAIRTGGPRRPSPTHRVGHHARDHASDAAIASGQQAARRHEMGLFCVCALSAIVVVRSLRSPCRNTHRLVSRSRPTHSASSLSLSPLVGPRTPRRRRPTKQVTHHVTHRGHGKKKGPPSPAAAADVSSRASVPSPLHTLHTVATATRPRVGHWPSLHHRTGLSRLPSPRLHSSLSDVGASPVSLSACMCCWHDALHRPC